MDNPSPIAVPAIAPMFNPTSAAPGPPITPSRTAPVAAITAGVAALSSSICASSSSFGVSASLSCAVAIPRLSRVPTGPIVLKTYFEYLRMGASSETVSSLLSWSLSLAAKSSKSS